MATPGPVTSMSDHHHLGPVGQGLILFGAAQWLAGVQSAVSAVCMLVGASCAVLSYLNARRTTDERLRKFECACFKRWEAAREKATAPKRFAPGPPQPLRD